MKKAKLPELYIKIQSFTKQYLPITKRKSPNTINAYVDTINLYLEYIKSSRKVPLSEIVTTDFTKENIEGFMIWLETDRKNQPTTINQRLANIRGFCKYLMQNDILSYADLNSILEIKKVSDTRSKELIYLSIEDTRLLLNLPNIHNKTGLRDKFFISLLYDSGCRNQEVLDLRIRDFALTGNGAANLHILGKGKNYRETPISTDVVKLFHTYCKVYHPDYKQNMDDLLFYTENKGIKSKMSRDNVQRFLNGYEEKAKLQNPQIPHLHPHLFRHTRAMHLYLAGVPLPMVSQWLGHKRMETTLIYAAATTEMKREAAKKLGNSVNSIFYNDEKFKYANDEEVLKKLSGLS